MYVSVIASGTLGVLLMIVCPQMLHVVPTAVATVPVKYKCRWLKSSTCIYGIQSFPSNSLRAVIFHKEEMHSLGLYILRDAKKGKEHNTTERQSNTPQLSQNSHFSKKNWLPRVGLKPTTISFPGHTLTNETTEAAHLAGPNHRISPDKCAKYMYHTHSHCTPSHSCTPSPCAHHLHLHTISTCTLSPHAHYLHYLHMHTTFTCTPPSHAHYLHVHTISKCTLSPHAHYLQVHTISTCTLSPRAHYLNVHTNRVDTPLISSYFLETTCTYTTCTCVLPPPIPHCTTTVHDTL